MLQAVAINTMVTSTIVRQQCSKEKLEWDFDIVTTDGRTDNRQGNWTNQTVTQGAQQQNGNVYN